MTKTACSVCNAALEPEAKFCPDCGARVAEQAPPPPPPVSQPVQQQPAYQPPQPVYQAPQPQVAVATPAPAPAPAVIAAPVADNTQLSVFGYILTMLGISIPIVGMILTFVWAFGSKTNKARKNYCRAVLILTAIFLLLTIVGIVTSASTLMPLIEILFEG